MRYHFRAVKHRRRQCRTRSQLRPEMLQSQCRCHHPHRQSKVQYRLCRQRLSLRKCRQRQIDQPPLHQPRRLMQPEDHNHRMSPVLCLYWPAKLRFVGQRHR